MPINMKKSLAKALLLTLVLFFGCKVQAPLAQDVLYNFIDIVYTQNNSNSKLYNKTFTSKDSEKWEKKINVPLWNNNLSNGLLSKENVNYAEIFSEKDIVHFKEQLRNQEQLQIRAQHIGNKKLITGRKNSSGLHIISQPIFNQNRSYSLLLREKSGGGEDIIVFQKVNNKWRIHSIITLSMV